jgi:phosphoenolpyruvate-protein kinase (PTS system EI component)
VPILLGFQLDEFSMAPVSIPRAKSIIRSWSLAGAKKLSEKVIDLDSAAAVRALVKEQSPG